MNRALGLAATVIAVALAPTVASAARHGLQTGFADRLYGSADAQERDDAFARTVEANASIVRVNVKWRDLVSGTPVTPSNPADPAYDFSEIDGAVQGGAAHGLDVILTVYSAPDFAESPGRPPGAPAGTWKPQPAAVADFATALATRYSGSYADLPAVRFYQVWVEPNLSNYLTPQYDGDQPLAPVLYRELLNAFHGAVKAISPANQVVTAGTAPYGDPPGGDRTRPLLFWRKVLCLSGHRKLRATDCPTKADFDVLAHHPINTSGGPRRSALHADDASTPDFKHVTRILRAAERHHTTGTGGRHGLWATELWWDSNPPDTEEGVPVAKHARYLEEALYLLWRQGADAVINLQLQDEPFDVANPFIDTSTGVLFADGSPKPAFTAFRFPFVTERRSKRTVRAWAKAPTAGRLVIQQRGGGGWKPLRKATVDDGQVFRANLRLRGSAALRAKIGPEHSLAWRQD